MTAKRSIVGGMEPLLVSYYTPDYKRFADRLLASMDRANIALTSRVVLERRAEGDWVQNCAMKASFLLECMERYDRPLVWIDADAVINRFTYHFDHLYNTGIDVAAHLPSRTRHPLCRSKLMSGTVFFNHTEAAKEVLVEWCVRGHENARALDQDVLWDVLFGKGRIECRFQNLPPELCQVFDLMADVKDPVITHYQASREMR